MKKEHAFLASICLLLSLTPAALTSDFEEDEDYVDPTVDPKVAGRKPVFTFCAMRADDGPCKALMKRFYFNILTFECEEFIYGGCQGNENRFDSVEECKATCLEEFSPLKKSTLEKGKPDLCFLEDDVGICRAYITRYFYNNQTRQCEPFAYGGCLGNLNNFESLEECKSTCDLPMSDVQVDGHRTTPAPLVTKNTKSLTSQSTKASSIWEFYGPSWCLTPADKGLCRANETRYFYDAVTAKCRPFNYSGCGGNENNFASKRACVRACKKGFIRRKSKEGLIKTKKKRKRPRVKVGYDYYVRKI
ncbi:Tissue factor pathway inhibitor [Fukomys damarensis]|uniref:Tissue factor pathway inhibitor n=2 Tax=Fukomys damarensis TaxID=885580 RepID=A0A091DA41_FUKDA|nr:Tissue factor pathway inhibitor [Fukomys damarensis]